MKHDPSVTSQQIGTQSLKRRDMSPEPLDQHELNKLERRKLVGVDQLVEKKSCAYMLG